MIVTRAEALLVEDTQLSTASDVVEPLRLDGYSPLNYQIVVTQDESEINEELATPGNPPAVCHEQVFHLRCKLTTSETDEVSIAQRMNVFVADVEKQIKAYANWYWFAGLAIDARFNPPTALELDGAAAVVSLPLIVVYRVDETDPYVVRA